MFQEGKIMAQQITTALCILRRKQVQERIGLARSSLYALIAKGLFPQPVKLSERAVGWRECDIDEWINSRTTKAGV